MNNDKELRLKRLEDLLNIRRETHSNLRNWKYTHLHI
jgi:hypothetical protein